MAALSRTAVYRPGGWFGEGTAMVGLTTTASPRCGAPGVVAGLPLDSFHWLLDHSIGFNRFVMNQLNERLGQFIARSRSTASTTPTHAWPAAWRRCSIRCCSRAWARCCVSPGCRNWPTWWACRARRVNEALSPAGRGTDPHRVRRPAGDRPAGLRQGGFRPRLRLSSVAQRRAGPSAALSTPPFEWVPPASSSSASAPATAMYAPPRARWSPPPNSNGPVAARCMSTPWPMWRRAFERSTRTGTSNW